MKAEKFSRVLGRVDDKYILEAVAFQRSKSREWVKWAAGAACVCILSLGVFFGVRLQRGGSGNPMAETKGGNKITVTEEGVSIPPMRVTLPSENTSACMIAFFIYQGRSYVAYETVEHGTGLVGEYLGTSTGSLDAWSREDEYVELSGSVGGDFYAVPGYDPSFLLCMREEDGIWLYVNNNGITLKTGRELFEERLHLAGRYGQVSCQTREDWYYGRGGIKTLDEEAGEDLETFISALNEGSFLRMEDIPLEPGETDVYDAKELYHMYFAMEDGLTVHLRLFEGGYVQFGGLMGVCVQVEETVFEGLLRRLEEAGA